MTTAREIASRCMGDNYPFPETAADVREVAFFAAEASGSDEPVTDADVLDLAAQWCTPLDATRHEEYVVRAALAEILHDPTDSSVAIEWLTNPTDEDDPA